MVLRLWDANTGQLTFDSELAVGGVCLGFYTPPTGGGSITFPDIVGATGFALSAGGRGTLYTTDNDLGYLRFNFNELTAGSSYALFAK